MRNKKLALVTYSALPSGSVDDKLLLIPLEKAGFKTQFIPWDKMGVKWEIYDALIVRSAWDYHLKKGAHPNLTEIMKKQGWDEVYE